MSFDLRAYLPNRISGQIVVLIVASLLASHTVITASFFYYARNRPPERLPDQLATLIELVAANSAEQRQALAASIALAFPRFDLELAPSEPDAVPARSLSDRELDGFAKRLGPGYRIGVLPSGPSATVGAGRRIAVGLPDGQYITAQLAPMPSPPPFGPIALTLIIIAFSVPLLGVWAALGLTGPLRRFAVAAENFDPNGEVAPVPERGPREIRVAARALNQMRERIKTLIDDRTRMLAAVSHDLRTPITRLRLQCEFIADEGTRAKILRELAHMESMVESVLHFLRDRRAARPAVALDLATSLQAICDQFADAGHDVSYSGPDHAVVRARPEELHRALTNLIDNAVRHGEKADVALALAAPTVTITIADDGPGIPDASKEVMFEAFVRGDAARGMNGKTGFGLGLSIARGVIEAHHGSLVLLDRKPRGLIAQVTLPQSAEPR